MAKLLFRGMKSPNSKYFKAILGVIAAFISLAIYLINEQHVSQAIQILIDGIKIVTALCVLGIVYALRDKILRLFPGK